MNAEKRIVWASAIVIMLVGTLVLAQGGPGPRGPRQGFGGPGQGLPPCMGQPVGPGLQQQGWGGPGNGMPPRMGPAGGPGLGLRGLFRLDLTQEQLAAIKAIQEEHKQTMESLRTAVQEARQTLQQAVVAGDDDEAIRSAATALGQAMGDAAIARVGDVKAIKAVLTEEQLTQLEAMKDQAPSPPGRMGWRGGMRQVRGGRGRFGGFQMAGPPTQGPGPEVIPEDLW